MLAYHSSTNMAYHLKYVSISNFTWLLNLMLTEKCVLTAGQMEVPVRLFALKKKQSNTSLKSVKTHYILFVLSQ